MPIRAVFFDVAHTLLYKPAVLPAIHEVMRSHGLDVPSMMLPPLQRFHCRAEFSPTGT